MIPDLHDHPFPEQPSRKKTGPEMLEIRKSYLSGPETNAD